MLGLMKKDFMLIRKQIRIVVVMMVFYTVILGFGQSAAYQAGMLGGYAVSFMSVMPVTMLSYDEKYKWGRYSAAMPVSRKEYVISKYLILLGLDAAIISAVGLYYYFSSTKDNVFSTIIIGCIALMVSAVTMAIAYKYGTNIARYIFMATVFTAFIVIMLLAKRPGFIYMDFDIINISMAGAIAVLGAVSLAVYLICMLISIKIYCGKDL